MAVSEAASTAAALRSPESRYGFLWDKQATTTFAAPQSDTLRNAKRRKDNKQRRMAEKEKSWKNEGDIEKYDINKVLEELGDAVESGKKAGKRAKNGSHTAAVNGSNNSDIGAQKAKVSKKKSSNGGGGKDNGGKQAKKVTAASAATDGDEDEDEDDEEEASAAVKGTAAPSSTVPSPSPSSASAIASAPSVHCDSHSRSVDNEVEMPEIYDLRRQTSRSTENLFTTVTKKKRNKNRGGAAVAAMDDNYGLENGGGHGGHYGGKVCDGGVRHGGGYSNSSRRQDKAQSNGFHTAAPAAESSASSSSRPTSARMSPSESAASSSSRVAQQQQQQDHHQQQPPPRNTVQTNSDLDLKADFPPLGTESAVADEGSSADVDPSVAGAAAAAAESVGNCWRSIPTSAVTATSSNATNSAVTASSKVHADPAPQREANSDSQAVIKGNGVDAGAAPAAAAAAQNQQENEATILAAAIPSSGATLPPDVTIDHQTSDVTSGISRPQLPDVAAQAPFCTGTSSSGENTPPGAPAVAPSQQCIHDGAAAASANAGGEADGAVKVVATEADYNRERESNAPIVILGKGEDWAPTVGLEFGFGLNEELLHSRPAEHQQQQEQQQHQPKPEEVGEQSPAPLHLEDDAILSFGESTPQHQPRGDQQHQLPQELYPVGDAIPPPQQRPTATEAPSVYEPSFLQIVCYVASKWQEVSQELKAKKSDVVYFQLKA